MISGQLTTSAALYFAPGKGRPVPFEWFVRACELFAEHNLSGILFSADGAEFLIDECQVLAERRRDLADALQNGAIESLFLESPRGDSVDRSDWCSRITISSTFATIYVGVDENLAPDVLRLFERALAMAKGLFDVRYGIAFKSPLADDPACYAIGRRATSVSEMCEMLRSRREGTYRKKKGADELWGDELNGQRRHLTGLFRGAYPANILSESHVRKADLRSHGIGRLSELDESLWLWELSEAEIPEAERILEAQGVLVRQAGQP